MTLDHDGEVEVSRETPATPAVAAEVFPADRLPLVERFAGMLAGAGVLRGLIGPREVPRLWERHLLNCGVLGEAVPAGSRLSDVGSGAGLPGLVLAIARPDLRVTLVEPLLRRTTFLSQVAEALSLSNVEVVRARAEALHGERVFDVVTSRAVAPLPRLLAWSMPLVAPDGSLIAMKGSSVQAELEDAAPELARWGCGTPRVLRLGEGVLAEPTSLVAVSWADPSRVSWPAQARSRPRTGRPGRPRRSRQR